MQSHSFLTHNPLRKQAYEILKEAIILNHLKENEAIQEKMAKERYGISRTPFREAIQALEADGWVQTIPYKGTFVSPLTVQDIEEIFELRILVEVHLLKQNQDSITMEQIQKLEYLHGQMQTAHQFQNEQEFIKFDRDFHTLLADLGNNRRIRALYDQLSDNMRRIGMKVLAKETRAEEVLEEHQLIIDCLRKGTGETALYEHLLRTKETFIQLFERKG